MKEEPCARKLGTQIAESLYRRHVGRLPVEIDEDIEAVEQELRFRYAKAGIPWPGTS